VFGIPSRIDKLSHEELRQVAPQVPSFEEVIARYAKHLHFMIELKQAPSMSQAEALTNLLRNLSPVIDFHFMSFNTAFFETLKRFEKPAFVTIAEFNVNETVETTLASGYGGCTGHFVMISSNKLRKCHSANAMVGTGFPASVNCLYREINRGVDWVFTNHALELSESLDLALRGEVGVKV